MYLAIINCIELQTICIFIGNESSSLLVQYCVVRNNEQIFARIHTFDPLVSNCDHPERIFFDGTVWLYEIRWYCSSLRTDFAALRSVFADIKL